MSELIGESVLSQGSPKSPTGFAPQRNKNVNVGFYESQGIFAQTPEAEYMDVYSKPLTSSAQRAEPYGVSRPLSRYQSRNP